MVVPTLCPGPDPDPDPDAIPHFLQHMTCIPGNCGQLIELNCKRHSVRVYAHVAACGRTWRRSKYRVKVRLIILADDDGRCISSRDGRADSPAMAIASAAQASAGSMPPVSPMTCVKTKPQVRASTASAACRAAQVAKRRLRPRWT